MFFNTNHHELPQIIHELSEFCYTFARETRNTEDYGDNDHQKDNGRREPGHQLKENPTVQKNEVRQRAQRRIHRVESGTESTVEVMRVLLDTCVIIDWATDEENLSDGVWDIIDDPENLLFISVGDRA